MFFYCADEDAKFSVSLHKRGFFRGAGYRSRTFSGSNPPTANFFRLLCSVHLPQKVREILDLKTQKTGPGAVSLTIPKPVFACFRVFRAISGPKTRKLPDLSGRQIRHLLWQGKKASNPRPTVLETAALPAELFPCI